MRTEEEIRAKLNQIKEEHCIYESNNNIMFEKGWAGIYNALEWVLNEQEATNEQ